MLFPDLPRTPILEDQVPCSQSCDGSSFELGIFIVGVEYLHAEGEHGRDLLEGECCHHGPLP